MVSTDGVSGRARRAGAEAGTSLGQAHRGLSPDRGSETWGHSGRVRVSWALGSWELRPCTSHSALRAALVPVPTAHLLPRRQLGWPCSRRSGEPGGAGMRDSEGPAPALAPRQGGPSCAHMLLECRPTCSRPPSSGRGHGPDWCSPKHMGSAMCLWWAGRVCSSSDVERSLGCRAGPPASPRTPEG